MGNISKKQRAEERVLELRALNTPVKEIAQQTGLSEMEVVDTIAEASKLAVTQRGIEEEAELHTLQATRKQRLSRLASLRDSLMSEIQGRGLKEIPAEKLLSCYLKVEEAMERNISRPAIYGTTAIEAEMSWEKGRDSI